MVRKAIKILPLAIGLSLLVLGVGSVYLYYTSPKQADLSGNRVVALSQCTQGYAEGNCPVTTFDWLGTLVNPSPNLSPGLVQVWGLQGTNIDTCGLPATYVSNIPTGSEGSSSFLPIYEALAEGIRGEIVYGSTVLFYTSSAYTLADESFGQLLATAVTTIPVQGVVSYAAGGSQTLTLGTDATYDFSLINMYNALCMVGGFSTVFGFFLASDKFLDP